MVFFCEKQNHGFSVIEVVVSIFIINMALIGLVALIVQNIQAQYVNKNNLIASQLAQEGVEMVRNVRDRNWIIGNDFYQDIGNVGSQKLFAIGALGASSIVNVSDLADMNTVLHLSEGETVNATSSPGYMAEFRRMASTTLSGDALNVDCIVEWRERGNTRRYIASEVLYNWIQ